LPLRAFFGGSEARLDTDVTIPTGTRDEAARAAREWVGFSRLKVKVGGGSVDDDVARVLAIHAAAPRASILLDGNAGLRADDAVALVDAVRARGVSPILFEQPVPADDLRGLADVARRAALPVAADESACTARDVMRLANERAAQVVNVKIMKSGIAEALAIVEVAKAAGLGLMIGGMVEAKLAMSTSACLAAGVGGFAFVDLDTPLFMAEERFDGGYAQDGETLDLTPIARGHGVVPRGSA
jgi:L-alanine-DL-glutamate epimerase-like enolase superfamily enzyme